MEVLETLLTQLRVLNPNWRKEYKVKEVLIIDDRTLRLHCNLNDIFVNIDIRYNAGLDVYEIQAHRGLSDDEFDSALLSLGEIILTQDWQNDPKYEKVRPLLKKIHDIMFGQDKIAEYDHVTWDQLDEIIKSILRKAKRWKEDLLETKIDTTTSVA